MRICPECGRKTEAPMCAADGLPTVDEALFGAVADQPGLSGRVLGERYRVGEMLGRGGMGWVFRAEHLVMGQPVAVKVMRREVAREAAAVKRFFREARACSLLEHHHTIRVHDFGVSEDGFPYLVMEYLDGEPLSQVLRREGPLAPERAARIAFGICKSLDEAHSRGLVHRDIKPSNVFLARRHGETDYVKVLDFGIARFVESEERHETTLTGSGMIVGTPQYASPEQAQAGVVDGRSDLYSLGVVLFQMLVGRVPFEASSLSPLLILHVQAPPPPVPEEVFGVAIPEDLRQLVAELLAKRPHDRPPDAAAVARRLAAIAGAAPALPGSAVPQASADPAAATEVAPIAAVESRLAGAATATMPPAAISARSAAEAGVASDTAPAAAGGVGPEVQRRRAVFGVAAGAAVVLACVVALWQVSRTDGEGPERPASPPVAVSAETPAAARDRTAPAAGTATPVEPGAEAGAAGTEAPAAAGEPAGTEPPAVGPRPASLDDVPSARRPLEESGSAASRPAPRRRADGSKGPRDPEAKPPSEPPGRLTVPLNL